MRRTNKSVIVICFFYCVFRAFEDNRIQEVKNVLQMRSESVGSQQLIMAIESTAHVNSLPEIRSLSK